MIKDALSRNSHILEFSIRPKSFFLDFVFVFGRPTILIDLPFTFLPSLTVQSELRTWHIMIVSFTASNKYFYFIFLLSRFCQVYQGFQVTQISVLTDIKWKSILWLGGVAIVLNMDRRRSQIIRFAKERWNPQTLPSSLRQHGIEADKNLI